MAKTLLMISPDHFGYNDQTAGSNSFQKDITESDIKKKVMLEFNNMVKLLESKGIEVLVFPSPKNRKCPDAVFPNNWMSTHQDGKIIIYPMLTPNRRAERNSEIIESLQNQFSISDILDYSNKENENIILEGTGSIVFDHDYRFAFACISPRTNESLLNEVCKQIGYTPIVFEALDLSGEPIYHTNVVMAIGKHQVVICLEAIENILERSIISAQIEKTGKQIIPISFSQMMEFAGNMLEVQNQEGESFWVMSETAFNSLAEEQKALLSSSSTLLPVHIPTIETIGGGSARCMMAEIYLDKIP